MLGRKNAGVGALLLLAFIFLAAPAHALQNTCQILTPTHLDVSIDYAAIPPAQNYRVNVFLYNESTDSGGVLTRNGIGPERVLIIFNENAAGICYITTDSGGKGQASFPVPQQPETCVVVRGIFCPSGTKENQSICTGLKLQAPAQACDVSQGAPRDSQAYQASQGGTSLCVDNRVSPQAALCAMAGLIFGLLFAAAIFQGRNPLQFFDFGSARGMRVNRGVAYMPMVQNVSVNVDTFANVLATAALKSLGAGKKEESKEKDKEPVKEGKATSTEQNTQPDAGKGAATEQAKPQTQPAEQEGWFGSRFFESIGAKEVAEGTGGVRLVGSVMGSWLRGKSGKAVDKVAGKGASKTDVGEAVGGILTKAIPLVLVAALSKGAFFKTLGSGMLKISIGEFADMAFSYMKKYAAERGREQVTDTKEIKTSGMNTMSMEEVSKIKEGSGIDGVRVVVEKSGSETITDTLVVKAVVRNDKDGLIFIGNDGKTYLFRKDEKQGGAVLVLNPTHELGVKVDKLLEERKGVLAKAELAGEKIGGVKGLEKEAKELEVKIADKKTPRAEKESLQLRLDSVEKELGERKGELAALTKLVGIDKKYMTNDDVAALSAKAGNMLYEAAKLHFESEQMKQEIFNVTKSYANIQTALGLGDSEFAMYAQIAKAYVGARQFASGEMTKDSQAGFVDGVAAMAGNEVNSLKAQGSLDAEGQKKLKQLEDVQSTCQQCIGILGKDPSARTPEDNELLKNNAAVLVGFAENAVRSQPVFLTLDSQNMAAVDLRMVDEVASQAGKTHDERAARLSEIEGDVKNSFYASASASIRNDEFGDEGHKFHSEFIINPLQASEISGLNITQTEKAAVNFDNIGKGMKIISTNGAMNIDALGGEQVRPTAIISGEEGRSAIELKEGVHLAHAKSGKEFVVSGFEDGQLKLKMNGENYTIGINDAAGMQVLGQNGGYIESTSTRSVTATIDGDKGGRILAEVAQDGSERLAIVDKQGKEIKLFEQKAPYVDDPLNQYAPTMDYQYGSPLPTFAGYGSGGVALGISQRQKVFLDVLKMQLNSYTSNLTAQAYTGPSLGNSAADWKKVLGMSGDTVGGSAIGFSAIGLATGFSSGFSYGSQKIDQAQHLRDLQIREQMLRQMMQMR